MGLGLVLRRLMPRGRPWETRGTLWDLFDALGLSFDRLRAYLAAVVTESRARTAVDTLPEWCRDLGLPFDSTATATRLQIRLAGQQSALGGQSAGYLQDQIQKELPNIVLVPVLLRSTSRVGLARVGIATCNGFSGLPGQAVYYYYVKGTVQDHDEYSRLVGLVERLLPKHLEPIFQVSILSDNATARVGLAVVGRARVGAST